MASLDTNILVRLLVQDDPGQTAAVSSPAEIVAAVERLGERMAEVRGRIARVIFGQGEVVEHALVAPEAYTASLPTLQAYVRARREAALAFGGGGDRATAAADAREGPRTPRSGEGVTGGGASPLPSHNTRLNRPD